jgi:hypothetical protein
MAIVKKVRTCAECKRTFANPESFRSHKYKFGDCRSVESLLVAGYTETPSGWKHKKTAKK